jgi:hypothetical protein
MSGWLTNGVPLITTPLVGTEQASFDTENTQGIQPETVAISTNQIAAFAATSVATTAGANINKLSSTAAALTATGTNLATALPLTADVNFISTAAASTGVSLPAAVVGMKIVIFNYGANTLAIYAPSSSTIDGTAGATGTTLTAAHRVATFYCESVTAGAGVWVSSLGGAVSS